MPGYCYNVRGVCEEDNCECSKHPELIKKIVEDLKTKFPKWEEVARPRMEANISNQDESDELPEHNMIDRSPLSQSDEQ